MDFNIRTTEEALQLFDTSEPVNLEFMKGQWKGYEIKTGHFIEGLLESTGWYGKLFIDEENVHPLLFPKNQTQLYSANPFLLPLRLNVPRTPLLATVMKLLRPLVQTKKAKARMRLVKYRGKLTGAMVYDHKAIIDVFAKVDDQTMLGVMDLKGDNQPYFFILERDVSERIVLV
ncbi:MAG: DUF4334 domain-containing protein [Bacteroidota bacterium]